MNMAAQTRYNPKHSAKSIHSMRFRPPARLVLPALLLLELLLVTLNARPVAAQVQPQSAQEFAGRIVAKMASRSAVALSVKNISSMSNAAAADAQRAIETELRGRGVRLVEPDRAVEVIRITFSENARGFLWVAEIGHDDTWDVVMLPVLSGAMNDHNAAQLALRRVSLVAQPEPILDVGGDERSELL